MAPIPELGSGPARAGLAFGVAAGARPIDARVYLAHEARGMLARLGRVKPLSLHETMVPAAAASVEARAAIEGFLARGAAALDGDLKGFLARIERPEAAPEPAERLGRAFVLLRLRFHAMLSHFDIFSAALTQRSEHETGVWLAGLDALAHDGLLIEGGHFEPPPLVCYLERGFGAAIRRARARLPGGARNPVAVIRIPRERMVGSGIAASLLHEVGHQGAALLDLVRSFRGMLQGMQAKGGDERRAWATWERWISEILADVWAMGFLGVGATLGLMSVVMLPAPFAFRPNLDDPHPTPWVRVMLSCAMGQSLYPDPQWRRLSSLWTRFYPMDRLDPARREQIEGLLSTMPTLVSLLGEHRPKRLFGKSLAEVLPVRERSPARLRAVVRLFRKQPIALHRARPTLVFAAVGQGRADGLLDAREEDEILSRMLSAWALRNATTSTESCARWRAAASMAERRGRMPFDFDGGDQ